ncbi:MAG: hypothetical protein JNL58_23010 [Planctomyces sp.]|nr:hypothetical protein [Planctomyces sp.]
MGFWTNQVAKSLPGKVAKTGSKATVGGTALLLALVMYLLFNFGTGMGTGSGNGESSSELGKEPSGLASKAPASSDSPDETEPGDSKLTSLVADQLSGGMTDDEKKALSSDVLAVLIDEREYFIEIPGKDPVYRPTQLKRILELAQNARGDSNGVRVRIIRRETARASAEEQLKLDLGRIGIGPDQIYMAETLIP